jgi:hypothetical protein
LHSGVSALSPSPSQSHGFAGSTHPLPLLELVLVLVPLLELELELVPPLVLVCEPDEPEVEDPDG